MGKKKKGAGPRYKNKLFLTALGNHCRRLRVLNGYSIDRMYKEGDKLSPGAIQRLETGASDVHVSLLHRYAQVLNVPIAQLFDFEMEETPSPLVLPFASGEEPPSRTVPYYSLDVAAGALDNQTESVEPMGWVAVTKKGQLRDFFAAKITGHSMEPTIPSGSICLFKKYAGGSRNGQILLVQARGLSDPESGGRYVVKRYQRVTSVNESQNRGNVLVRLISDNKKFAPIELRKTSEEEISTLATFVEIISEK